MEPVQIVNNSTWRLVFFFLQTCYLVSPLFMLTVFLTLLLGIIIFQLWVSLLKEFALGNRFLMSLGVCKDFSFYLPTLCWCRWRIVCWALKLFPVWLEYRICERTTYHSGVQVWGRHFSAWGTEDAECGMGFAPWLCWKVQIPRKGGLGHKCSLL